jgi:hypothetical protein
LVFRSDSFRRHALATMLLAENIAMRFSLESGTNEKHVIEFSFNQLLGRSSIKVDGQEVFKKERWFSEPLAERYEFEIGQFEPVHLRIEKERQRIFASKYRVYLDNRLTQLYQGV